MHFFYLTKDYIYTIGIYDRDGEKTEKENKNKIEQKKNPFNYSPIPRSIIWMPTVFRYPRGLKQVVPSLMEERTKQMGQKKSKVGRSAGG